MFRSIKVLMKGMLVDDNIKIFLFIDLDRIFEVFLIIDLDKISITKSFKNIFELEERRSSNTL